MSHFWGSLQRFAETPLAHPPDGRHRGSRDGRLDLRNRERKTKDGRHVDLDFYDLLIEVTLSSTCTVTPCHARNPHRPMSDQSLGDNRNYQRVSTNSVLLRYVFAP